MGAVWSTFKGKRKEKKWGNKISVERKRGRGKKREIRVREGKWGARRRTAVLGVSKGGEIRQYRRSIDGGETRLPWREEMVQQY